MRTVLVFLLLVSALPLRAEVRAIEIRIPVQVEGYQSDANGFGRIEEGVYNLDGYRFEPALKIKAGDGAGLEAPFKPFAELLAVYSDGKRDAGRLTALYHDPQGVIARVLGTKHAVTGQPTADRFWDHVGKTKKFAVAVAWHDAAGRLVVLAGQGNGSIDSVPYVMVQQENGWKFRAGQSDRMIMMENLIIAARAGHRFADMVRWR
jgi:hypothetical protein